jgi:hypothetical protein
VTVKIIGWRLEGESRAALLAHFPPRYERTVADHVTHGRADKAPPLPQCSSAEVIGCADDDSGVQALVVAIDGSPARWDGGRYHLTWSLGPERNAKESNAVIADHGWQPVADAPALTLNPAEWP